MKCKCGNQLRCINPLVDLNGDGLVDELELEVCVTGKTIRLTDAADYTTLSLTEMV